MAEVTRDNLLSADKSLFEMYLSALDAVVTEPEISVALNEFDLSAGNLRMKMVIGAEGVLRSATREFAAYQDAMTLESITAPDPSHIWQGGDLTSRIQRVLSSKKDTSEILGWLSIRAAIAGVLITVGGVASSMVWPWMKWLVWAGGDILVTAILVRLLVRILRTNLARRLQNEERDSLEVIEARNQLISAISKTELLAQARTFINAARESRFGLVYAVVSSPRLSEVYDSINRVATNVATELDGLINRVEGASIGVAGARGSGKSTLIRQYCEENSSTADGQKISERSTLFSPNLSTYRSGDLRCLVAAPVDYVARDFVLHLFATFCRVVISYYDGRTRQSSVLTRSALWLRRAWQSTLFLLWRAIFYAGSIVALLYWKNAIARRLAVPSAWVYYAAIAVLCAGILDVWWTTHRIRAQTRQKSKGGEQALTVAAAAHLSRVRFLQTYTSEWSGSLTLVRGTAQGQHKRGVSRAEQPLSYPEIVDDFRSFASKVAKDVHRTGDRVFIGVDELDKIGSAEQAEHFLNEIKGIFGVPNLYFMVSVSDDALTSFERRGLPLRDAFDSSFDEIIQVGPLSYAESRRLLYRRVIGLTEPYVALCHCVAGGLARELVRAARQVVRTGTTLTSAPSSNARSATTRDGDFVSPNDYTLAGTDRDDRSPALGAISAAVIQDELRRKLSAVGHVLRNTTAGSASDLQDTFHDIPHHLGPERPILNILDLMAKPGHEEPPEVVSLRLDFSAYVYYCATLQEVFTDRLDKERIIQATSEPPESGSFESLANARNAFTIDTALAWRLISQFRKKWCMEIREPMNKDNRNTNKATPVLTTD